jgi:hypothetical protein
MTNKQEPIFVNYAHQGKGSQFISLCEDALFAANMERSTWTDQEIESGDNYPDTGGHRPARASHLMAWTERGLCLRFSQRSRQPTTLFAYARMSESEFDQSSMVSSESLLSS